MSRCNSSGVGAHENVLRRLNKGFSPLFVPERLRDGQLRTFRKKPASSALPFFFKVSLAWLPFRRKARSQFLLLNALPPQKGQALCSEKSLFLARFGKIIQKRQRLSAPLM